MKKIYILSACLVSLAIPASAQFGKLKSLVGKKDKPQQENTQAATPKESPA